MAWLNTVERDPTPELTFPSGQHDREVTLSRCFKSRTMRFGVPLSVPGARYVEHCYSRHGKGFAATPPPGSAPELVLITRSDSSGAR